MSELGNAAAGDQSFVIKSEDTLNSSTPDNLNSDNVVAEDINNNNSNYNGTDTTQTNNDGTHTIVKAEDIEKDNLVVQDGQQQQETTLTTMVTSTTPPIQANSNKTSPTTGPVQYHPHQEQGDEDDDHNELNLKRSLETNEDFEQSKAKKLKNTTPQPSKVIHLRNLPIDCTEHEIMAIAAPFGQVEHILILKGKSQGFIQFAEITSASSFIQFYTTIQGSIRAKNFFVQYSNRDEITSSSAIETPNNILLVTISNIIYPVTIEVLYQLFSKYGSVLKILIFSKSGNFQSLVQLHSLESAIQCIKYNNDKSRDFTNPTLLPGNTMVSNPIGYGNNTTNQLMSQHVAAAAAAIVNQGVNNQHLVNSSSNMNVGGSSAAAVAQSLGMTGLTAQAMSSLFPHVNSTAVLIVGGLPPSVSPNDLFNLFGVYGDPIRIKIMFNKKDTALIQMNFPHQAELALQYLNNVPFRGSILRVNLSKHASISMPKSGDAQSDFTKDYTGSTSHRFKQPGSKNYQNIHPPSHILHLSNLPQQANIESLVRDLFSQFGNVLSFNLFNKDTRMALIEMSSLEESVNCLVKLHGHPIGEHVMKVSFAKSSSSSSIASSSSSLQQQQLPLLTATTPQQKK